MDVQTGKAVARRRDAHAASINRVLPLSESAVASGDDEGAVHLWDTRQARPCPQASCGTPREGSKHPYCLCLQHVSATFA